MRTESFPADDLTKALRHRTIATMPELKKALGTEVDATVLRKLKRLAYRTSYSHRGAYYALDETARFDEKGLWSFQSVWFSRWGTLPGTVEAFVEYSAAGCFVRELDNLLHAATKEPLLKLVRQERVTRQPVGALYLYCSIRTVLRERQLLARRVLQANPHLAGSLIAAAEVPDEMKAAIVLFFSMLDEKQRRLYAGLESLKLGYGGDQRIAAFLGMDPHTVAKGRRELIEKDFEVDRIRKAGGGRKPMEKNVRNHLPNRRTDAARYGRRPHVGDQVDPENNEQHLRATRHFGDHRKQEHGRSPAEEDGLQTDLPPPI